MTAWLRGATPIVATLLIASGTASAQPPPAEPAEPDAPDAPDAPEDEPDEADAAQPTVPPAGAADDGAIEAEPEDLRPEPETPPIAAEAELEDDFALDLEPAEAPSDFMSRMYGYIESQWRRPIGGEGHHHHDEEGGALAAASEEHEPGFALNANVMLQGTILQRYRFFVNLAAPNSGAIARDFPVLLRNAWVEAPILGDLLVVRAGKTYRRFGLYNEILDARPTFMGIEAPEILVQGHLLLPRTTNLMVHGSVASADHVVNYALMTGRDESAENVVPIGADVHYDFSDILRIGTSFYWTGGDAIPTAPTGSGARSNGGVMGWMERDEYLVYGGYAQLTWEGLTLQVEYWRSPHEATRDVDAVLELARRAELNDRQIQRFFGGDTSPTRDDVNTTAEYTVRTFWARAGYEILLGDFGALTPYVHFDYLNHPEAIADEALGGNEAGIADDGRFFRLAGGFVYRPVAPVAFKAELNPHFAQVNGSTQINNELRLSLSYYWELW